ncbi:XdhC family protein [Xanthomonas sp. NCPPB 2654]|uniref:XdhC family protein n=1 Tax=unclassified Xanthomonas TaxID=2643310 RepID=UPI0021DFEDB2|nr:MULTISPECIES: XdhC/CoxI family protein [unclassified Xanthomonas]MDL5368106.1 XdhC family protein [Xanthomonas sp. NCPPB 2654]UYC19343.1 XdhC family protein [Xanthomonas sp. CFBP 8443]
MSAARHCLHAAIVACRQRAPAVLVVVMASEGSTYAHAGAIALFGADGAQQGWLSGGCLEPEIARCAARAAAAGALAWMEIDTRDDDDLLSGSAVGCRGRLRLALLPLAALPGIERLAQAWLQRRGGLTLALDGDGGVVAAVAGQMLQWWVPCQAWNGAAACGGQVQVPPPPRVSVFGAGPETAVLLPLLRQLGWMTTLVEQRPRWMAQAVLADLALACTPTRALADCADSDAALVMHHHFELDREALDALAGSTIPFLGLLGPPRRREDLFRLLRPQQHAQLLPRLHAPVGLRLGGSGAEAIALSIAAQLQATRTAPPRPDAVAEAGGRPRRSHRDAVAPPVPLDAEEEAR